MDQKPKTEDGRTVVSKRCSRNRGGWLHARRASGSPDAGRGPDLPDDGFKGRVAVACLASPQTLPHPRFSPPAAGSPLNNRAVSGHGGERGETVMGGMGDGRGTTEERIGADRGGAGAAEGGVSDRHQSGSGAQARLARPVGALDPGLAGAACGGDFAGFRQPLGGGHHAHRHRADAGDDPPCATASERLDSAAAGGAGLDRAAGIGADPAPAAGRSRHHRAVELSAQPDAIAAGRCAGRRQPGDAEAVGRTAKND